jgi:hypothetical protein
MERQELNVRFCNFHFECANQTQFFFWNCMQIYIYYKLNNRRVTIYEKLKKLGIV